MARAQMRVLLIEDDEEASRHITRGLESAGHAVESALDGNAGLRLGAVQSFDVMIIDRMLPGLDGLSIVESLRTSGIRTPVLLLTSLGGIEDRVDGLDAGADDYLVKPFAIAELRARVNALGRRLGNDNEIQFSKSRISSSTSYRGPSCAMAARSISRRASFACSRRSCAMPAG